MPPEAFSRHKSLWERLQLALQLRGPWPTAEAPVQGGLQLVLDVGQYLSSHVGLEFAGVTIPGTGWQTLVTVPKGERWRLIALKFQRATGDRNMDGWALAAEGRVPIAEGLTAVSEYRTGILEGVWLPETGTILINITGGVTNGTWSAWCYVDVWRDRNDLGLTGEAS